MDSLFGASTLEEDVKDWLLNNVKRVSRVLVWVACDAWLFNSETVAGDVLEDPASVGLEEDGSCWTEKLKCWDTPAKTFATFLVKGLLRRLADEPAAETPCGRLKECGVIFFILNHLIFPKSFDLI